MAAGNPWLPRPQDYHVAWISAIETEYRIACQMLDEVFAPPSGLPRDDRCYTFGRIHGHNVVMARLPEKRVGTEEAAKLATDMNRTFQWLRIGLMVGIAGGVSSNDVRLGDVVVSAPDDKKRSGGVLHYGFGASVQEEGFRKRGVLNSPPGVLLTAISHLKNHYDRKGIRLGHRIQLALNTDASLVKEYARPAPSTDILYVPDFIHSDEHKSCAELGCMQQISGQVERAPRPDHADQPVIRHGIIASAGVLVRDATLRDTIAREDGVLCFEMESAGLMNERPGWMAIRGICDYADTHKNKEWQNYAAVAAAVYAKDLLSFVQPWTDVDITGNLMRRNTIGGQKIDILEILSYDNMYNKRKFSTMQEGYNVDWIWKTQFSSWLKTSDLPFWVCGKPGSGKSTLIAHLVNEQRTITDLESDGKSFKILHFFYDHRAGKAVANTPQGMLRMFLHQLADQFPDVKSRLQDLAACQRLNLESVQELKEAACEAIRSSRFKFCVFVDGLDEYKGNLLDLVFICDGLRRGAGIKLCLASREEARVTDVTEIYASILMQEHNETSMLAYAGAKIAACEHTYLDIDKRIDMALREEMVRKAEGIILWFKLVFDKVLREYQNTRSSVQVHDFVHEIPPGLESVYERLLESIELENRGEAAFVLHLVFELSEIMRLVDFSTSSFDYLWGLYDFITAQSSNSLQFGNLDSATELKRRIKRLLPGLVDTAKPDGLSALEVTSWLPEGVLSAGISTFLDVRFVHGTFLQYLKDTDWIGKYMPEEIKLRYYSNDFWPRIFSDVFHKTEVDNLIDDTVVRECLREIGLMIGTIGDFTFTRFSSLAGLHLSPKKSYFWAIMLQLFPCTWQGLVTVANGDGHALKFGKRTLSWIIERCSGLVPFPKQWETWHALLRLSLGIFIQQAKEHEKSGSSTYPLVLPALQSHFVMIAAGTKFESPLPDWLFDNLIDKRNAQEIKDLVTAIVCDLPVYFADSLSVKKLSAIQQQDLLRAAIAWFVYVNSSTSTVASFLAPLADQGVSLSYHDLRFFLLNSTCLEHAVAQARGLRALLRTQPTELEAPLGVNSQDTRMNDLLIYWGQFSCLGHEEKCNNSYIVKGFLEVLDLILDAGADINSPCCNGVTVMQAIIDKSISPLPGRCHTYRKAKFLALVRRGAIFPTMETRKRRSLRRAWSTSAADTDFIYKCLERTSLDDNEEWKRTLKVLEIADGIQDVSSKFSRRSWRI